MALTYWEVNLAGDIYNTNTGTKVGINNVNPVLELDVIGSIGLTSLLEFKKSGNDVIQLKSASSLGYDFAVYNSTKGVYRLYISNAGKVGIGTNATVNKFTVIETTPGNAWAAASFTNTSTVGFGIEVTGGNEDNSTAIFKNYNNQLGAKLSGRGELFVRDWIASNAGTSVDGKHHFRMENNHLRFSFLLEDVESGSNNEGSNFSLRRYSDAGDELGKVIKVIRNTGEIIFYGNTLFSDALTVTGLLSATSTNIPLRALGDVSDSAIPTIEGAILRVVDGMWDIADVSTLPQPDLSPYLTKPIADTYYASLTAFNGHVNNQTNPHQVSLQEILAVNNYTTYPLLVGNYIAATSLILENVTFSAAGEDLTIDGNVSITGNTTFTGNIALSLFQLSDVDDLLDTAPDGYILKKVSGIWTAAIDKADTPTDLSDYYTKTESDNNFVNVIGDSMTGGLSISTASNALTLTTQSGNSSVRILYGSEIIPSLTITPSATDVSLISRDADKFIIKKQSLGDVITVNADGSISFGDLSKLSSSLGSIGVYSTEPKLTLHHITQAANDFVITNKGSYTELSVSGAKSIALNAATANVELFHNNSRRMRTTATGIEVFDTMLSPKISLDGLPMYKSADGKLVIEADVVITGEYKEGWSGVGTGTPPGADKLTDLSDVGIQSILDIGTPFVLGRDTGAGKLSYMTSEALITMLDVVTTTKFEEHTNDTVPHVSVQNRLDWDLAYGNISNIYNWDLIYSSHTKKEIGLSDVGEPGSGIGITDMKYIFYWTDPNGNRKAIKTRFSDNADHLHEKPWDEFRHTRALGYTPLSADNLYSRGLYDLGTVHQYDRNVPTDGSWQIETIDASFTYNQNAPETEKHKFQWATRWIDRENSFDLWARGRDGSTKEWLPWVQFNHSGNTPPAIELYPEMPTEAYDELENELNWTYEFSTPDDVFELYIGETEGIDWAFQIGHRVVNKQYVYEVTPIGIKRFGNNQYIVVEVTTTNATTELTIAPHIDRYEITMHQAANDIPVIINHKREKPIVINLDNTTLYGVDIYYTQEVGPNIKLIDMEPDVIIEVHPGIWQLN